MHHPLPIMGTQNVEIEIRCSVDTQVLGVLRNFCACTAREAGFNEEQVDQIEMAVDEAAANVIRHAYKHLGVSPDLPEEIRTTDAEVLSACKLIMRITLTEECLRICIIDNGRGINAGSAKVSSMEEFFRRGGHGGLGTYIIRHFMDEVEYGAAEPEGTMLTMTKYLDSSSKFLT